jgi:hypothetical protein
MADNIASSFVPAQLAAHERRKALMARLDPNYGRANMILQRPARAIVEPVMVLPEPWPEPKPENTPMQAEAWFKAAHEAMDKGGPSIKEIRDFVCQYYRMPVSEILSERRYLAVTRVRHIGMFLAKTLSAKSYPAIAKVFSRNDHTTILSAIRKIDRKIAANP